MIRLYVSSSSIAARGVDTMVSGEQRIHTCTFELSPAWDGLDVHAVIRNGNIKKRIAITGGEEYEIPWEVLATPGQLSIGVIGTDDQGRVKKTVDQAIDFVRPGASDEGADAGQEATPDLTAQLYARVGGYIASEEARQEKEQERVTAEQERARASQEAVSAMNAQTEAVHAALTSGALNGRDGAPGRDGVDGKDGKDGKDGAPGEKGADGADGAPGADAPQIDDTAVTQTNPWSSRQIIDTLCPAFEEVGNPVTCYPVAGSPLSVKARVEPVQHFDWVKCEGETTQITTTGANLLDISQCTVTDGAYGLAISIEPDGYVRISGTLETTNNPNMSILYCRQDELRGRGYVVKAFDVTGLTGIESWGLRTENERAIAIRFQSQIGTAIDARMHMMVSDGTPTVYEPYTGGKPSPSPAYPQALVDSIPAGAYYVPSTAPEGGYWRIDLNESLGGLGDYKDALEVDTYAGRYRVVAKIATFVCDENKRFTTPDGTYFSKFGNTPSANDGGRSQISSHFSTTKGYVMGRMWAQGNGAIVFGRGRESATGFYLTDESFNDYLAAQYAAGTPVTIRYAIATPTVTIGQATLVTSTTGMTALNVTSMGLTSPDPEHPCEITVAESVQVHRFSGKNLCDIGTAAITGATIVPINSYIPAGAYTISVTVTSSDTDAGRSYIALLDRLNSVVAGRSVRRDVRDYIPFTSDRAICAIYLCPSMSGFGSNGDDAVFEDMQIEVGTTATTYQPYNGNTYNVELANDFQGGTVNLTSGTEEKMWGKIVLDGTENYRALAGEDGYWMTDISPKGGFTQSSTPVNAACTHFATAPNRLTKNTLTSQERSDGTTRWIFSVNDDDMDNWKSYLAAEYAAGHPVTIYYKLAEPTSSTLSPTPLLSLPGCNTIMTDAQEITVAGRADPVRIITNQASTIDTLSQRIAALEDAIANH